MRRLMRSERLVLGLMAILFMISTMSLTGCGKTDSGDASSLSSEKAITAFSISSPAATGIVDENAKTISVTLPFGTDVTALIATFTATGAAVSVGADLQVSGSTPNDFTNPVAYTVTAGNTTKATYTVTVAIAASYEKAITTFSFADLAATAIVDESTKTISVTVPFGTEVTALIATFTTTGTSVTVGATIQVSGITPNDFTSTVDYTVTAADSTTAIYAVIVTVASPSTEKQVTAFSFTSPATIGTIDEGVKTISVTVPYRTDISSLIATFITTGKNITTNNTLQVSGTTPNNFTNPVIYTVIAEDDSTTDYTVTVTVALNPAKAITACSIVSPAATGIIDENAKTILVTVPYGTSDLSALVATFASTGVSVSVSAIPQVSGITPNDFTNPVDYTVIAENGIAAIYTVTVIIAPISAKAITGFGFANPVAIGVVDEDARTILVNIPHVPHGTGRDRINCYLYHVWCKRISQCDFAGERNNAERLYEPGSIHGNCCGCFNATLYGDRDDKSGK